MSGYVLCVMTQAPGPYDDRIRLRPYNPIALEEQGLHDVVATCPRLLRPMIPRLGIAHTYNHFQLSDPSTTPYHDELNSPQRLMHPSYSPLPAGSQPMGDTPANCGNPSFPKPSEIYDSWGSSCPSPYILPNTTCGISPPTHHHSTLDPTLFPHSTCRRAAWSVGNIRVNSVDKPLPAADDYHLPAFPLHNASPSPDEDLGYTPMPCSGTLDASASYPCLWTQGGAICNVMVQATRSHMNRHLHACHGFGGSDTRQTRCNWAGCGETMQQGSIARHMVTCHLQAKVTCPMCFKKLSRQDVISKHQRVCPAAGARR